MTRLAELRSRRERLVAEMARTRLALRGAAESLQGWSTPVTLGLAAGQALSGRPWLRFAALAGIALTMLRRFASR